MAKTPKQVPQEFTPSYEDTPYIASDAELRAKAALTVALRNSLTDVATVDLGTILGLVPQSAGQIIKRRWDDPAFQSWLRDTNETEARVEYLYSRALDAAAAILSDTDPKTAAARVQMIRLLADLGSKIKPRNLIDKEADATIQKLVGGMDAGQLMAFVSDGQKKLGVAVKKESKTDEHTEVLDA